MRGGVLEMRIGVLFMAATLLLSGCEPTPAYDRFEGATMGTYFRVTALCPSRSAPELQQRLEAELAQVNGQMSTYQNDSELMRFNTHTVDEWVPVSNELLTVIAAAGEISRWSSGAFDVTVSELVDLWGFGPDGRIDNRPSDQVILDLLGRIGHERLEVDPDAQAIRRRAPFQVDLSAIAKGHGVDRVSQVLRRQACTDFLVDIGGEVLGEGLSPSGRPWRIGVEVPDPGTVGGVQRVIPLESMAVATSGDYRNFQDLEGRRYSHTLDPRTGEPVQHDLASVTVLHPSAMWADGLATALNVLGQDEGFALAESRGLAALFVIRGANGFEERYTPAMQEYLDMKLDQTRDPLRDTKAQDG